MTWTFPLCVLSKVIRLDLNVEVAFCRHLGTLIKFSRWCWSGVLLTHFVQVSNICLDIFTAVVCVTQYFATGVRQVSCRMVYILAGASRFFLYSNIWTWKFYRGYEYKSGCLVNPLLTKSLGHKHTSMHQFVVSMDLLQSIHNMIYFAYLFLNYLVVYRITCCIMQQVYILFSDKPVKLTTKYIRML